MPYTIGIPDQQYRRATQVLGPENANPIEYDTVDQGDGFYLFSFPEVDEFEFQDIVILLQNNGVTTIGADEQLTERKIMKLTDLLNEQEMGPEELGIPANDIINRLKLTLESWRKQEYRGGGLESCERSNQYDLDIEEMIEEFTDPEFKSGDERSGQISDEETDDIMTKGDIQEQKLRKIIRKMIRK